MANDAFALSPMSASAALPSEADYEAISEAFMETSRGRWFLKEYARRNRNADTAMVLEAVARIETAVAAQTAAAGQPDDTARLDEALTAFRAILEAAHASTEDAIAELSRGDSFGPARKAVRVVREVAWRFRELGYDGRICDILETQANTVDANLAPTVTEDLHQRVATAFAQALTELEVIARGDAPAATSAATSPPPPMPENVVSLAALKPAASVTAAAEPAPSVSPPLTENTATEWLAAGPSGEAAVLATETEGSSAAADTMQAAPSAPTEMALGRPTMLASDQVAAAGDELEHVVAAEALDGPTEKTAAAVPAANSVADVPAGVLDLESPHHSVEPETLAGDPSADAADPIATMQVTTFEAQVPDGPSADTLSLGASLLARGMVSTPRPDPMAPLRRMTQVEKIAFFS